MARKSKKQQQEEARREKERLRSQEKKEAESSREPVPIAGLQGSDSLPGAIPVVDRLGEHVSPTKTGILPSVPASADSMAVRHETGMSGLSYMAMSMNEILRSDRHDILMDRNEFRRYIDTEVLQNLMSSDEAQVNDSILTAILNLIRLETREKVVVVSTFFAHETRETRWTRNMYQGDIDNFEVAIIPVHIPSGKGGHWTCGIYKRDEAIYYYDSLGVREDTMPEWIKRCLKRAVKELTNSVYENVILEIVPVGSESSNNDTRFSINQQIDSVNCGIYVALNAESYLLRDQETLIENLDIKVERARFLKIVLSLCDENYQYVSRQENLAALSRRHYITNYRRKRRANETEEERSTRLIAQEERQRMSRGNETEEERSTRLIAQEERQRMSRDNETQEERSKRLSAETTRHEKKTIKKKVDSKIKFPIQNENDVEFCDPGDLSLKCENCSALFFEGEFVKGTHGPKKFNKCCNFGNIKLSWPFESYPHELYMLLVREKGQQSKCFHEHMRNYNSAYAFGSMRAESQDKSTMPFCYKIQGQIYHTVNLAAHPEAHEKPSYAQMFFIDSKEAIDLRLEHPANEKCKQEVMEIIDQVLFSVSPYYHAFKTMKEVEDEENEKARQEGREPHKISLVFDVNADVDKRRYNIPRSDEVAAVFVLKDGEQVPPHEGIAIHQKGKKLQVLSKFDKRTESMIYPLFFPNAKGGSYAGMRDQNGRIITFNEYYRHLTAIRPTKALVRKEKVDEICESKEICTNDKLVWSKEPGELTDFNPLRLGGKLYQQYLVDSYVKAEQDRLDYMRYHQKRVEGRGVQGLERLFGRDRR